MKGLSCGGSTNPSYGSTLVNGAWGADLESANSLPGGLGFKLTFWFRFLRVCWAPAECLPTSAGTRRGQTWAAPCNLLAWSLAWSHACQDIHAAFASAAW